MTSAKGEILRSPATTTEGREGNLYTGVLDSDPGCADGLSLREGVVLVFSAEHVIAISRPPEGYVLDKYGPDFFDS